MLFGPKIFDPSPSRVGSGSATLVSPTGKIGKLGSVEAGVTVSHSGGAAAVDDTGTLPDATVEIAEEDGESTATAEELVDEAVALRSFAAGNACINVAQHTKTTREGLKRAIIAELCSYTGRRQ